MTRRSNVQKYWAQPGLAMLRATEILRESLTLSHAITTFSLFARRSREARSHPELQTINQIGAGLQGTIFEQVGKSLVMKKENIGNESLASNLQNECQIHRAVLAAFDRFGVSVNINSNFHVPQLHEFISKTDNDQFWSDNLSKLPQYYRTRTDIVKMERILPLTTATRRALVAHFHPQLDETNIESILAEPENKHCFVRIYLGQDNTVVPQGRGQLRNFPLSLKSMKELRLDVGAFAAAMGKAFAIMQWGAGVDGDDVEFVLGTSSIEEPDFPEMQHRAIGIYLLDFGQCRQIDLSGDVDDVYQAFKGAMVTGDNRLFIPKDPAVYSEFRSAYVKAAQLILEQKGLSDIFNAEDFTTEYEDYVADLLL